VADQRIKTDWIHRPLDIAERPLHAFGRLWNRLGPGPATWRGATIGLALGALALWVVHAGWLLSVTGTEPGGLVAVLVSATLVALVGPFLSVLAWLAKWFVVKPLRSAPVSYRWVCASAFLAAGTTIAFSAHLPGVVLIELLFIGSWSLLGGGLAMLLRRGGRGEPVRSGAGRRAFGGVAFVAGLLLAAWQVAWLVSDGQDEPVRRPLTSSGSAMVR